MVKRTTAEWQKVSDDRWKRDWLLFGKMILAAVPLAVAVIWTLMSCSTALPLHTHNGKQPPTEVNVNLPKAAKGDVEAVVERLASSDNWPLWLACMVILLGTAWLSWRKWMRPEPRGDGSLPLHQRAPPPTHEPARTPPS